MASEEEEEDTGGVGPGSLAVLGVIFLPAGVVALAFYLLLRRGRFPMSSLFQVFIGFEILVFLLWTSTGAGGQLAAFFTDLGAAGSTWTSLLWPLTLFYSAVGGVLGLAIVWWEIRQMKVNPHRLELKGNWQYKFKFRRTLGQTLRRKKRVQELKQGNLVDGEKAPLGINEIDDRVVSRYYSEAEVHTMISGASGSGKTLTMQSLIRADLENHVPTFVVDFKRSPEFASKLAAWADENGCEFYHFVNGDPSDYDIKHSKGPVRYDPLSSGTPTAKADMVLGMREYDTASAVYKANMQQLLQVLFAMIHYGQANREKAEKIKWDEGGMYLLASVLSGDNFTELAIACEGTPIEKEAQEVSTQLKTRGSGLKHAFEELQGQLRTIVASEYGQWMRTTKTDRGIDIFELAKTPGSVVLFSLNSDSEPEFAKYVGSMILADITNTSAKRRNQQLKNPVHIYVDEFQAVTPSAVTGLLEKSREAKMAVTLAQQSFEQIVKAAPQNGEAYLLSILDTCSNFLIHNGMTEDSAERLSKILGKHTVTKYRSTNKNQSFFLSMNWKNKRDSIVSTSEEEEWVFAPREFMSLMSPVKANGFKSTAVLINKSCSDPAYAGKAGAVARRVWMIPALEVLESYYDPAYRLNPGPESSIDVVLGDGSSAPLLPGDDLRAPMERKVPMRTVSIEELDEERRIENDREIMEELARIRAGRDADPYIPEDRETAFVFEEIEDEDMSKYKQELEEREQSGPPAKASKPKDVGDLWEAGPPPRREPSSKPSGLPIPEKKINATPGGLPTRPQGLPIPKKNDDDEPGLPLPY